MNLKSKNSLIDKTKEEQATELKEMAEIAKSVLQKKYDCKKCNGTGKDYWDVELSFYKPCDCILKAKRIIELEIDANKNETIFVN